RRRPLRVEDEGGNFGEPHKVAEVAASPSQGRGLAVGEIVRPLVPGLVRISVLERHEQSVIVQPVDHSRAEGLEVSSQVRRLLELPPELLERGQLRGSYLALL